MGKVNKSWYKCIKRHPKEQNFPKHYLLLSENLLLIHRQKINFCLFKFSRSSVAIFASNATIRFRRGHLRIHIVTSSTSVVPDAFACATTPRRACNTAFLASRRPMARQGRVHSYANRPGRREPDERRRERNVGNDTGDHRPINASEDNEILQKWLRYAKYSRLIGSNCVRSFRDVLMTANWRFCLVVSNLGLGNCAISMFNMVFTFEAWTGVPCFFNSLKKIVSRLLWNCFGVFIIK